MAKSMRKMVLLAKIHAEAGTDPIPTGAANAMLCRGITPRPVVAEFANRDLIRPYFGNSGQLPVSVHSEVEFEVELAGAGVAGELPAYDPLLRACGFAATVEEDVSVTYTLVSDDIEMVAVYLVLDGIQHKMLNAHGTVAFEISARGIPVMRFRFMGAYTPLSDAPMPSGVSYAAFHKPVAVNKTNTPEWSAHGYTGCLQTLSVDMQNQLAWRALIGCEGAAITNRTPTGSLVLEAPAIADLDWPAKIIAAETGLVTVTHGVTPGNIVQINIPKAQLTEPSYSDQDGVAMLNVSMSPQPDVGNDEVEIIIR